MASASTATAQPATTAYWTRIVLASGCELTAGSSSPEGVVTGDPCDLYLRTDGGAGTVLYLKESGAATNTGWVAVASGGSTITGSGTTGKIAKFTGTSALGNSILTESAGRIGVSNASPRGTFDVLSGAANTDGDSIDAGIFTGPSFNFGVSGAVSLALQANDDMAADKGGSLAFGFRATTASTAGTNSAAIVGAKSNGTSGNNAGYLAFYTRPNGGGLLLRARIADSGELLLKEVSGYTTGAGGTVTQLTSKTTGVTINAASGQITMQGGALADATTACFVVTNNKMAATDTAILNHGSVGTVGAYIPFVGAVASGSFTACIRNVSGGSLSEAIVLHFAIVKGASS